MHQNGKQCTDKIKERNPALENTEITVLREKIQSPQIRWEKRSNFSRGKKVLILRNYHVFDLTLQKKMPNFRTYTSGNSLQIRPLLS